MVAGREVSPKDIGDTERLKAYWLHGKGAALWVDTDKPWTNLRNQLLRFLSPELATLTASRWFFDRFGFYSGSDLNRVTHGKAPRGKVVGPG